MDTLFYVKLVSDCLFVSQRLEHGLLHLTVELLGSLI